MRQESTAPNVVWWSKQEVMSQLRQTAEVFGAAQTSHFTTDMQTTQDTAQTRCVVL